MPLVVSQAYAGANPVAHPNGPLSEQFRCLSAKQARLVQLQYGPPFYVLRSMNFTHDWHTRHGHNWVRWLAKFVNQPARALEIGCFEGCATTWMLQNIFTHPQSTVTVIDTFEGSEEHAGWIDFSKVRARFEENIQPWKERVNIYAGTSERVLRQLLGPFDFVYVDGSHKAADVLTDACLVWPLLAEGGILIFDDYDWHIMPDPLHNPQPGVDAFLSVFIGKYALIAKEYQVVVSKK